MFEAAAPDRVYDEFRILSGALQIAECGGHTSGRKTIVSLFL